MTRFELVIDTPFIIANKIWSRINGVFKVLFKWHPTKSLTIYSGIDSLVSFRLYLNRREFAIGAFNLMLWVVRDKNEI